MRNPIKRSRFVALLVVTLVTVAGLAAVSLTSATDGTTHVDVSSTTIQTVPGPGSSNVAMSLAVSDPVNTFDITLNYDPTLVSVAPTDIVVNASWLTVAKTVDDATGVINVQGGWQTPLGGSCAGGSTCPMFTVTWHSEAFGVAPITLDSAYSAAGLWNAGSAVAFTYNGGTVTIAAPTATPTLTNTPIPPPRRR